MTLQGVVTLDEAQTARRAAASATFENALDTRPALSAAGTGSHNTTCSSTSSERRKCFEDKEFSGTTDPVVAVTSMVRIEGRAKGCFLANFSCRL